MSVGDGEPDNVVDVASEFTPEMDITAYGMSRIN
jgi:hypothetical protein